MRTPLSIIVAVLAVASPVSAEQPKAATPADRTITVSLSNFAFEPAQIRLKAGVQARLRLVNDSSGGHDFSAPAFFGSSTYPPGSSPPVDGDVAVAAHRSVEITLVPRAIGIYRVECTHFLHSLFGMHGTIEVTP